MFYCSSVLLLNCSSVILIYCSPVVQFYCYTTVSCPTVLLLYSSILILLFPVQVFSCSFVPVSHNYTVLLFYCCFRVFLFYCSAECRSAECYGAILRDWDAKLPWHSIGSLVFNTCLIMEGVCRHSLYD